jgi:hypothetical protein
MLAYAQMCACVGLSGGGGEFGHGGVAECEMVDDGMNKSTRVCD